MGTTRIYVSKNADEAATTAGYWQAKPEIKAVLAIGPTDGIQVAAADMSAQHWADSNGPWYAIIVTSDPAAMDG